MLLLDLYCKAGGAGAGYARAGFTVIGVDIKPQKHYPFTFVQADALEYLQRPAVHMFDAIHASPPCQKYSTMTARHGQQQVDSHPDLVAPTRDLLIATGKPYIIENVPQAPLLDTAIQLCGSSFGLKVRRHRRFETNFWVNPRYCQHHLQDKVVGVYGHAGGRSVRDGISFGGVAEWREAMDIDWMTGNELAEAVPPAYTKYIGEQLMAALHA